MLALHASIVLLIEILIYTGLGASIAHTTDWPMVCIVSLLVVLALGLRLSSLLVTRAFSTLFGSKRPAEFPASFGNTVRMIAGELWATLAIFSVLQPLERWLGLREPADRGATADLPVLLIHGFICNGAYWWPLVRLLRRQGIKNVHTLNLEPAFGPIEAYVEQVARRVEQILQRSGADRIVLVAHSMGGLVALAYLYSGATAAQKVAKIVTLATPHHGTVLGGFSPTRNARQMRPGSDFLANLNRFELAEAPCPITAIFSYDDNIIVPQESSRLGNAKNIPVAGVGHVAMSFSVTVQRLVREEISALRPDPSRKSASTSAA